MLQKVPGFLQKIKRPNAIQKNGIYKKLSFLYHNLNLKENLNLIILSVSITIFNPLAPKFCFKF